MNIINWLSHNIKRMDILSVKKYLDFTTQTEVFWFIEYFALKTGVIIEKEILTEQQIYIILLTLNGDGLHIWNKH